MLFLARITNKPDVAELRAENMSAHYDYIRANSEQILLCATSRREPESASLAFFWIITAESFEEADRIIREDPFWKVGMRQAADITYLIKALPDLIGRI